uniref:Murein L,D-transpeptidase YafK n=1 Tax=Candidatus Kentrum sp. DK TaxID=2126562 RepID=A0A450TBJ1_9GAMM|nr:MAG: Murein L,D-transpeptidase YafK [Candidatus Kentron sp. DK]
MLTLLGPWPDPATGATLRFDTHLDSSLIASPSVPAPRPAPSHETEKILMDSLTSMEKNGAEATLHEIEAFLESHPKFRLAQLIHGDLLLSKGRPITDIGNIEGVSGPEIKEKVQGLREEARRRTGRYLNPPDPDTLPGYLIRPGRERTWFIVVEMGRSRLYLYENKKGKFWLRGDFYASAGKNGFPKQSEGDQKTPIGVYRIVGNIPADDLPDRYGAAAFPVDYPNAWDKRLGRTGHGIWIHGVASDTYSRPPHSSDGCIAMANEDLLSIKKILAIPGTPVIITEQASWMKPAAINGRRLAFEEQFERWRRDWESRDRTRYARHYSRSFRNRSENRSAWLRQKALVNSGKRYIRIGISDLAILGYPGEPDTVEVVFAQDYRSNNYNSRSKKRQYWRLEKTKPGRGRAERKDENAEGVWRIVYEDAF